MVSTTRRSTSSPRPEKRLVRLSKEVGGGGEYSPRQMVAGKSSEKTDRLRLDLEMEGNIKEESVEKVTTLRDLLVKESMEMRVWGMGTRLKRPKR